MYGMFEDASAFNQDLCLWGNQINNESTYLEYIFSGSGCVDTTTPTTKASNWCQVCQ
jgi:hypothetical protein